MTHFFLETYSLIDAQVSFQNIPAFKKYNMREIITITAEVTIRLMMSSVFVLEETAFAMSRLVLCFS